jgi:hypothetical protein
MTQQNRIAPAASAPANPYLHQPAVDRRDGDSRVTLYSLPHERPGPRVADPQVLRPPLRGTAPGDGDLATAGDVAFWFSVTLVALFLTGSAVVLGIWLANWFSR